MTTERDVERVAIGRIPLWNVLRRHGVSQDIAIQIIAEAAAETGRHNVEDGGDASHE